MKNEKNLKLFANPQQAEDWVWRVKNGVVAWVYNTKEHRTKSAWKFVHWVSKQMVLLKEDVTLKQFAGLVSEECGSVLPEGETEDTIFYGMGKFKFSSNLTNFDKECEKSFLRSWKTEVEALLTIEIVNLSVMAPPTLEDRMREFAENAIATGCYDIVRSRPTYYGSVVSLSVEKYLSRRFRDDNRHSNVIIFECVEGVVTEDEFNKIYMKFHGFPIFHKKLYIVSTCNYTSNIFANAEKLKVGLVFVNLQHQVTEDNIMLPRSSEYHNYCYWHQMLTGEKAMTLPFIACDCNILFFSMREILWHNNISVKRRNDIEAPYLTNDEIEEVAFEMIKVEAGHMVNMLRNCCPDTYVPDCIIDPFKLAVSLGLKICWDHLGSDHARIDIQRKTVTISQELKPYYHCTRFDLSHEMGHYLFHQEVMEQVRKSGQEIKPLEKWWLEHHANHFASCLLMPAHVVRMLYHIYYKKLFPYNYVMPMRYDGTLQSKALLEQIVGNMAARMNVSKRAMYLRLLKMELVNRVSPVQQFLSAS